MFNYAVAVDRLGRSPCRGVRPPRRDVRERRVLTTNEIARLAEATDQPYRAMVWLGAVVGLRYSEVAGLRVGRLDLLEDKLTVAETVTRDGHGGTAFGPPKSAASRRTVALPRMLTELLAEHPWRRGLTEADANELVFVSPDGGPLPYENWRNRIWLPACQRADLEGIGFHDLRRLSATLLVAEGVDTKTAQFRLGHSDVRLTLGLYAQTVVEAERVAADRLGERFFVGQARCDSQDGAVPGSSAGPGPNRATGLLSCG